MKTVLIFGAGLTRAACVAKSKAKRPPLDKDFFDIADSVDSDSTIQFRLKMISLAGNYTLSVLQSLETATSYLYLKTIDSEKGSDHHLVFLKLLKLLYKVLASTTNGLKVGPASFPYQLIRNEFSRVSSPDDISILTFNYDLLVERALDEIDKHSDELVFSFPGCYRLPSIEDKINVEHRSPFEAADEGAVGVSLLKLHGSMNWLSAHNITNPAASALFRTNRSIYIVNSPILSEQYTLKKQKKLHMQPVIVPPVGGKRGVMHDSLLEVWNSAAHVLRQAHRIVVVGYSCPLLDLEAHILLSENLSLNKDKELYIVDPNPDTAARLVNVCGVDRAVMYKSLKGWLKGDGKGVT